MIVHGNVARSTRGAVARAPERAARLNDGNDNLMDRAGFAGAPKLPCEIYVDFPEVYRLRHIRFLLWHLDGRTYTYTVEVSPDGQNWEMLEDRSQKPSGAWQNIKFDGRPVKSVRVTGLSNTANESFHIIEFEAYCHVQPDRKRR